MASVPFIIRGVYTGLVDLEGIARLEPGALVLEFQTVHALSDFFKSRSREIRIPLQDIEAVSFQRRLLTGVLKIRAGRLEAFRDMPGATGSEIKVRCRREHFAEAEELASRISMRAVTEDLREMIAANDRSRSPRGEPPNTGRPGAAHPTG
jgi:hypothetical protein